MTIRHVLAAAALLAISSGAPGQVSPLEIPFVKEWASSAHARVHAEAFTHWDAEGEIPVACAKCHSSAGFRDFLGVDGSEAGQVDGSALVGGGVDCVACHNDATRDLYEVTFPSGATVTHEFADARCMECHQGRSSTKNVNEAIDKAGAGDDETSGDLRFVNVHYRAAAATRYGTEVKGGYEYEGKEYVGLYLHDEASTLCTDCHDSHTLRVAVVSCTDCHDGLEKRSDLAGIRTTKKDFDGNGNIDEGIKAEIDRLHAAAGSAIRAYAEQIAGKPIVYDAHQYPYFFYDLDADGKPGPAEARYPNRYQSWTPRLLRAAYNYQYAAKDPGAYTHNPFYVIQLLQDSIADLSAHAKIEVAVGARP